MVYKKYVKRGGKTFGPYYYESYRDVNGKVKTRYLENYKPRGISSFSRASKKNVVGVGKYVLVFALVALLGFFAYSTFNSDNSSFSGKVVFDENISSDIPGSVDSSPNINETIVPPVVDETLGVVDETIIIPVVNETIIEIINNETINETIIIPVVNETINETTNETVANETINNEAINNETVILENIISGEFNVTTTKARIVI
ncbi:MAG: hypothetical protein WCP89_02690, partial [archaeon]